MNKKELRTHIRRLKSSYSAEQLEALSRHVVAQLQLDPHWCHAHNVLLYHSLPDEVDTHDLIISAVATGKRVALPVVVGDELELRWFTGESSLTQGTFHILEPTGPQVTELNKIELAVIPGVAFTRGGSRLGRGRGYYDRLLSRMRDTYKIGLCWPFQLVGTLPSEEHDILMDDVIQ